jgi:hypothetical protein
MTCLRPIQWRHAKANVFNLTGRSFINTKLFIFPRIFINKIGEEYRFAGTAALTWQRTWRAPYCRTTDPISPSSSYPAPSTAQTHPDNPPHPHLGTYTVAVIPGPVSISSSFTYILPRLAKNFYEWALHVTFHENLDNFLCKIYKVLGKWFTLIKYCNY